MPLSQHDTAAPADPFAGDTYPEIGYNRVWFNLMRIQRSLGPRIARALREAGLEDPVWYEILLELEAAGPEGMAMADLEAKLYMPQYALSRQARRLEETGWIRRTPRPGPGRGQTLALTEAGKGLETQVWKIYEDAIRTHLQDRLSTDEAYTLARMLIRLYP